MVLVLVIVGLCVLLVVYDLLLLILCIVLIGDLCVVLGIWFVNEVVLFEDKGEGKFLVEVLIFD